MKPFSRSFRQVALLAALAAGTAIAAPAARAGSSGNERTGIDRFGEPAVRSFADQLNRTLDAKQVTVAIIARSGRPRSELPRGITYTHVAFAVFEPVKAADGTIGSTYVVYNLYQGDGGRNDRSYLAQDFTYSFAAGSCERDIGVIVPSDELQQRILAVIHSPAYRALQNPHYNLVANPYRHQYDNCATHTLRVVTAAIYRTDDDARVEDDIRAYFQPSPVQISPLKRLGASLVSGIEFDDQDAGHLQTASFDSIRAFLSRNGLAKDVFTVTMPAQG